MRRVVVVLSVAGLALGVIGALFASLEAALAYSDGAVEIGAWAGPARPAVIVSLGVAVALAWTAGVSRPTLAREVDQRLGLADRTSSALAVADGMVTSALGERVLSETSQQLDAAAAGLDKAFPARPRRRVLWLLRAGSILVGLWVAIILLGRFVGSGGGGMSIDALPGTAPRQAAGANPGSDAEPPPPESADDEPDAPDAEPEADPDPEADPEPDAEPDTEPPEPLGPLATADLVLSAEEFAEGDPILTLAIGKPGVGLTAPRGFTLTVEVDGQALGTGKSMPLSPADAEGGIVPVRLAGLAGAADVLKPGQHEAVLILEPEGGGAAIRSEPKSFRIRGGDDGGGGGQPPPPPPQPEPQPEPESQPPPPPPEPEPPDEGGGEEEGPPDEGELPDLPEQTEKKIVVPLFNEGPEVEKIGPRLVLVPGAGPDDPPRRIPLEQAWEEARRRAEANVDRAGVREADKALVRRYFERLKKLMDDGK